MEKKILCFVLSLVLIVGLAVPVQAYGEDGHNKLIEEILFGDTNYIDTLADEAKNNLQLLEYATMICLDQYNNSYEEQLGYLRKAGIYGIPDSVEEINFTGNQYHRKYTHKGWDEKNYPNEIEKQRQANWPLRKEILSQTVNHVFEFDKFAGKHKFLWFTHDYGYNTQCDSFSAFLYYLHILGEYQEVKKQLDDPQNTRTDFSALTVSVIPLARAHPNERNIDVFWELEKHLPNIFESSINNDSHAYSGMMSEIKEISVKARKLASETGGITEERFPQYCNYAEDLVNKLKIYVPKLLKNEKFFSDAFNS